MKKHLRILFLLTFFIVGLGTQNAQASHVMGMDMQWKSIGNDTFEITFVAYRRCTNGAAGINTPSLQLTSDICANTYYVNIGNPKSHTVEDITPVCVYQQKPCSISGGSGQSTALIPVGIERHSWVYKVYLGGVYTNCCWYKLGWSQCCRNNAITTGPASSNQYDYFWLNRCVTNSSPKFNSNLLLIHGAGSDIKYNLGMIDNEGDSLSYELATPIGATYNSPWSSTYPITCLGGNNPSASANPPTGFNIDPITGDLAFRPMQVQVSVIKIMVYEWRKDASNYKLIGLTNRELELYIIQNINNKLPTLSSSDYNLCPGTQTCFTINTNDQNSNDSVRIYSNSSLIIPSSTFTSNNDSVLQASGTFCWTPNDSDIRQRPYFIQVHAVDNHCPVYGISYKTIALRVHPQLNITTKIEKLACANYNFIAISNDPLAYNKKWEVYRGGNLQIIFSNKDSIMNYKFTDTGTYILKFTSENACGAITTSDTLAITNVTILNISTSSAATICKGDSVTLGSIPLTGVAPYSYKWYLNDSIISTSQIITVKPLVTSKYIVEIFSSDSCKINDRDTVDITISNASLKINPLNNLVLCLGANNNLTPTIISGKAPFNYKWYKNGILVSTASTLSIAPVAAQYILNLTSSDQCNNQIIDSFDTRIDSNSLQLAPLKDTSICYGTSLMINPVILKGSAPFSYFWYRNGQIFSNNLNILVTPLVSTNYELVVHSADYCSNPAHLFMKIDVGNSNLDIQPIKDTTLCHGSSINISPNIFTGKAPLVYKWYRNNVLISTSPILTNVPAIAADYVLHVTSADYCINENYDTFAINVFPTGNVVISAPTTTIYQTQSIVLKSNGISNFNWQGPNILNNWGDSIRVQPMTNSTYTLICINSSGCIDTGRITIVIDRLGLTDSYVSLANKLKINPNPAKEEIFISYSSIEIKHFSIFNILGQVQMIGELKDEKTSINISALKSGIYFIKVDDVVKKFIKE